MNALIIGLYGIFLLLVGVNGNQPALSAEFNKDAPGFLPWAVSIAVLAVANEVPATQKLVGPFFFLLILTFVLRNFETLRTQFNQLSQMAQSAVGAK